MNVKTDKHLSTQYSFELGKQLRVYDIEKKTILPKAARRQAIPFGGDGGVPLSYNDEKGFIYCDASDSHTLVLGPTGSKKSRLVAMPTVRILAAAGESMIISDPKAEIYEYTSGYLKSQGYRVMTLNLREPTLGSSWNPFIIPYRLYCRGDIDRACEFISDISANIIAMGKSKTDPFWDNSAGSVFFGLSLLMFKWCFEHKLGVSAVNMSNVFQLRNMLFSGNKEFNLLWKYAKTDNFVSSLLIGSVETANDTKAGILSVFDQKMRIFTIQPNLMSMLATNDFDFDTVTSEKTAIFVIMPDEKTSYHGLVSLFVKQSYEQVIFSVQKREKSENSIRLNYILDEFSSLPTIADFPAMITAARSRNIRFNIFVQSKHQLQLRYEEEAETIQANCTNWIFLSSRELKLLEEISALCGNKKMAAGGLEPILPISELQRLDKDKGEALVFSGRQKPYLSRLADIDKYDKRNNKPIRFIIRRSADIELLTETSVLKPLRDEFSRREKHDEMLSVPFPNNIPQPAALDVGELIQRIDEKINELENEEITKSADKPDN